MYIPLTFEGTSQRCLYARGGYEGYWVSGSQQYGYHLYTGSATFTVDKGTISNAEIFVVGGGGGGGNNGGTQIGGGGGGGGVAYQTNVRLFGGSYTITVGAGGAGGIYQAFIDNPGATGGSSSFNGSNYFLGAGGGQGGRAGASINGGFSGDPTRFSGGTGTAGEGGGGAGATGAGINANVPNNTKSQGGPGYTYQPTQYQLYFGCGGGGTQIDGPSPVRGGCYQAGEEQSDANPLWAFGCGGGGGAQYDGGSGTYTRAGNGSSGCVIIKYPINTPCNDYFIGTGSCGCTSQTYDISDVGALNPFDRTGSFTLVPCGYTASVISGSLLSGFAFTVCGVSGSTGSVQTNGSVGGGTYTFGVAGQARCLAKDRPC